MASSGPHSNGFSLIRKILEVSNADLGMRLENPDGSAITLGDALLAPTMIYVKPMLRMLETGGIDGLAHITGGGLTDNIVRVLPEDTGLVIHPNAWQRPAVYEWLQENGKIEESEMLRTFNCGIGMVMLAEPDTAEALIKTSLSFGIPCHDIGYVSAGHADQRVQYRSR
jgi:phosphoribosylformylglycinamidine cyclo-ligase